MFSRCFFFHWRPVLLSVRLPRPEEVVLFTARPGERGGCYQRLAGPATDCSDWSVPSLPSPSPRTHWALPSFTVFFFVFFCFPFCSVVPGFRCSSIAARVDLFCWLVFFPFCRSAVELKGTDAIERNSRTAADRRRLAHPAAPRRAGVHGAPPIGRDRAGTRKQQQQQQHGTKTKTKRIVAYQRVL